MKAQELRIGNYVIYNDIYVKIASIIVPSPKKDKRYSDKYIVEVFDGVSNITTTLEKIKQIKLTKSWLEKIGFNEHDSISDEFYWQHPLDEPNEEDELHHIIYINWQDQNFIFIEISNDYGQYGTHPIRNVNYIHQLQNLYFSLTGKELEIKK